MGYLAVLMMGTILGVLGGGGGILAVPILVGLFGVSPVQATGQSLFIVGLASLVGAAQAFRAKQFEIAPAAVLAVSGVLGAFAARLWVVPNLPPRIAGLDKGDFLMVLLAVVMVFSGVRMIRPQKGGSGSKSVPPPVVVAIGLAIGLLSGSIGAGGGFLIVPALTMAMGMDMKRAVPTSLFIISVQSLGGFAGELARPVDWNLLLPIAGVALVGMGLGAWVRPKLSSDQLKPMFAGLIFLVATYLLFRVFS